MAKNQIPAARAVSRRMMTVNVLGNNPSLILAIGSKTFSGRKPAIPFGPAIKQNRCQLRSEADSTPQ
jgi:hypothetical protein